MRTWLPAIVLCGGLLTGCTTAFSPFEEDVLLFSVFGYLDVQADTQFVHVSPLRNALLAEDTPLEVTVTLEQVGTGVTEVWQDSVVHHTDGRVSHIFWSTTPVLPRATYRFAVTRPDGQASTATVTTPADFPAPILVADAFPQGVPPSQSISVRGVEKVAYLELTYHLVLGTGGDANTRTLTVSYLDQLQNRPDLAAFFVGFEAYQDILRKVPLRSCPQVVTAEVLVVAAGNDWPDLALLDLETLALPDAVNNISHGVGYLGAVASKRIAWTEVLPILEGKRRECGF
jgi:hypothetical protein